MKNVFQISIAITKDDARMVDRMTFEDGSDNRSAFIRKLIRQQWARRHPSEDATPVPDGAGENPNN